MLTTLSADLPCSLRARRRRSLSLDVQITAQGARVVHRRHTPVNGLKEDEVDDSITVVDVPDGVSGGPSDTVQSTQELDDDDLDNNDDSDDDTETTPSSSPSATATTFPIASLSGTSITTIPTLSSPSKPAAIWLTGIPLQTSSYSTSTTSTSTTSVQTQTVPVGLQTPKLGGNNDNNGSSGSTARGSSRPDGTRMKVAIAFGTIG